MTYNFQTGNYVGTQTTGRQISVDGDIYAQERDNAAQNLFGADYQDLTDAQQDRADAEVNSPDSWDADMEGVTVK